MRVLLTVCTLLPLLLAAAHAAEPVSAELLSRPFSETYQPEVEVSGNVIVGVMSAAAQRALADDRLGVRVPEAAAGAEVCVRATSSDGIYSSRNHYRLPAAAGSRAHLPYASGMGDVLGGFAPGELAVSIAAGSCEAAAAEGYLVAGMVDEAPAQPVLVYLNGFGATDVFASLGGDGPLEACEYITEGRRTTYDFFCTLTPEATSGQSVTIVRERFGREQPSVTIKLLGDGG